MIIKITPVVVFGKRPILPEKILHNIFHPGMIWFKIDLTSGKLPIKIYGFLRDGPIDSNIIIKRDKYPLVK